MLIKENKPKFNILLRDDKTYPYIYFSSDHDFPGVYLKRTKKAVDRNYFGPFVSSEAVKKSIKEIQKIYKVEIAVIPPLLTELDHVLNIK